MKGNMCPWREKVTFFWLKLIGGPLQKRLENHQRSNLCLWRAICAHEGKKWRVLGKTDGVLPTKKAGKSPKKQLCVYERQYVPMKRKSKVYWLKLIGGPLRKRLRNHQKSNLCLWRARCAHEGKKWSFWVKLMGCTLQKRLENQQKSNLGLWRAICAHERKKWRFLSKTDKMPPTKKAGKSPKKQLCVYERQYVPMKRKSKVYWVKLIGSPLQKRLENHQKSNLCLWRAICAHEGKNWWGAPYIKGWKISKKATCVYEKEYVDMKGTSGCFVG